MPLSTEHVEHIARLARLNLSPEEIQKFTVELTVILDYIDQLKAVATELPSEQAGADRHTCPLREDIVRPSLDAAVVLGQAPRHTEQFILVPKVLG